ncbi:hybrid sensor histidine kinase/response regulator [Mastigocoleus testarum]|uniref:histidine kinase n=1 Tax=Mastigocoleus testarum BC008 TaxID=371196 RepID=A0A0V7ZYE8_9CYAN|nr:response regulator [Mastigocoleus testarum]KST69589.1 hypothetical protein BC008_04625 [Mastigocoleus testarum BC008]
MIKDSSTPYQGEIIIIDDTPANLHLLANLLKEYSYKVRPFPSGKLALAGIKHSQPDLILLDIQMPNMDGYQVCEQLKANEISRDIPVIFISALNEALDKVKAFTVGGIDYITKPFQAEEVLARVNTHLQLSSLQKMLQQENYLQAKQLEAQNIQLQLMNNTLQKVNQELKLKYNQLQQAQLQLVQSEKMATLGQLVAGVAHEINNPVGFISGNLKHASQYIRDLIDHLKLYQQKYPQNILEIENNATEIDLEYLLEDLPNTIKSMKVGTDRIEDISTSLRTFSRSDTTNLVKANLHEGIDSTLLILKHRLKANEYRPAIEIIKEYGNLPEVECYPGQLNQVFMNIIANAIDALDESIQVRSEEELNNNPCQITISTEVLPTFNDIAVRIKDNGIGMSKELEKKVFEYLFTTKGINKGTGLGLSISLQIVQEKHQGKLTYISCPGKGTEFTIELPIQAIRNMADS